MIIKQLLCGHMQTFTYIIGCEKTGEACVIDPVTDVDRVAEEAQKEQLKITYIFNTHHHADHTNGNRDLKKMTDARIVIHKLEAGALRRLNISKVGTGYYSMSPKPDIIIDKQKSIRVGSITFDIIHTPGHTPGGLCFYSARNLFTGDTLFTGCTGRTDLPGGNAAAMGRSLRMLFDTFPPETVVWPGHDYGETPVSTLEKEKMTNMNGVKYGFYS